MRQGVKVVAKCAAGAVALLIIAFLVAPFADVLRGQVTVYSVVYSPHDTLAYTAPREYYKVFPETQTVVYWSDGAGRVGKLANCSVVDRMNWTCEYSDKSATLSMKDGKFDMWSREEHGSLDVRFVTRFEWWRFKLLLR